MEDLIKEIKELELNNGLEFKNLRIKLKKKELIERANLKKLKKVDVGDYVLTWHPKLGKEGAMMIYTKDSYKRAQDFISKKAEKGK